MTTQNNKLGEIFSAYLRSIQNFYDPDLLSLIQQVASSSPSASDVEVAITLLGPWAGTGLQLPIPIPPAAALTFPQDHGDHFDTPIEWRYFTLSLDLKPGGKVSIICNIFRKAIATAACAPSVEDLDRQIYSTSIAVTVALPGAKTVHYPFPVKTFSSAAGDEIFISNEPFMMKVGTTSIGAVHDMEIFPMPISLEDPGDSLSGRPPITVNVIAGNDNPFFLQGIDGYVGSPASTPLPGEPSYYYYSWPQQSVHGSILIGDEAFEVSGICWLDHQWGGTCAPTKPNPPPGGGWAWFEFQFDNNRSLTCSFLHGPIVDGQPPAYLSSGLSLFIENKIARLVDTALAVKEYTKSTETNASYPSSWEISLKERNAPDSSRLILTIATDLAQQALWMGGLTEYSEAASMVVATDEKGTIMMTGVGYCEGVGFEDGDELRTRAKTWLQAAAAEHRT